MVKTKKILGLALPLIFTTCLPTHQDIPQRFLYEPPVSCTEIPSRTSIKFAYNSGAFGVSIQTGNRVEIYGFSNTEGFERFSYHIDERGMAIADSGFDF